MLQTRHTPGPWVAHTKSPNCASVVPIGFAWWGTPVSDETKANAALIAAAPSMLNALTLALATIERLKPPTPYDSTQGTRDVINQAINQATGREGG